MAAALAPAFVRNPIKERSSSPDESACSMQHFLIQESICTSSHTDTEIGNLLQEITRLRTDENRLEQNTDRDIEDIISEAEILVSETSNKVNRSVAPAVSKINYLPYRQLMRKDAGPKPRVESSEKAVKKKKDMPRSRVFDDDHIVENKAASCDLDLKTILANKIPSKESLNVSEEQFVSSFLQIKEVTNSSNPIQSPQLKKTDVHHKKLNCVLEKLEETNEKLHSVQIQYEMLVESNQQLKAKNEELTNKNQRYETKLSEKNEAIEKLYNDLEIFKLESTQLTTEISHLKEETERLQGDKQNLTFQSNKDKICIMDLQRQCKEMEGLMSRRHPDSVSALIVASKQPYFEGETKKLLEKRVNDLESEAKNIEDKHKKTLLNIHEKVNSMKQNYETHIADLEKQVINLQTINSEMKELARNKNNADNSTQTGNNCVTATTQTLTVKPNSGKGKNQNTNGVVNQVKEDGHLVATVRGLNSELILKEKSISKLTKELNEAKRVILKFKDTGAMSKSVTTVARNNDNKKPAVPKYSNIKIMKISTNALENNPDKIDKESITKPDNDKINSKSDFDIPQKDFEILKKKKINDLVELQNSDEKELMSLNLKVLTLQHDVDTLNSTVETLQNQIQSMDKQISEILIERDKLKYNAELKTDINSECLVKKRNDRGYDDLNNKIMELEKRYEGREVILKTLIYSLNKKKDAHVGGIAIEAGNCTISPLKSKVFHSC